MEDYQDRKYPRVEVQATMDVSGEDLQLFNRIENISLSGACVILADAMELNQEVELVLNLPSGEELVLQAIIVWSKPGPEPMAGVRFVDLDEGVRESLRTYLYSQEN